jgi:hypothetical protein
MQILTLTFWKAIWIWCKVNWKFLVGFGIPVVIGILLRQGKQSAILKKGLEFRKKQIEIERQAAGIEKSATTEAIAQHAEENQRIEVEHLDALDQIEKDRKEKLQDLSSADKVTAEINKRLED